jgi:hypothetical protein
MAEVLWLTSAFRTSRVSAASRIPGAYAGRARFQPCDVSRLPPQLACAAGTIVELGYAGVAPAGEPFAGQPLYLEWRTDTLLHGFLIPEQDLEFMSSSKNTAADVLSHRLLRATPGPHSTRTA